jgi:Cupredoxin-like domain
MSAVRATKLSLLMASLTVAWVGSGCGHTRSVGTNRTLSVALGEYRLNPENVRVSQGTLMILVHNYGRLTHNLVISANGQTVGATKPIPPGQSAELDVSLAAGAYSMASTIQSDEALGEFGTLTVTS